MHKDNLFYYNYILIIPMYLISYSILPDMNLYHKSSVRVQPMPSYNEQP